MSSPYEGLNRKFGGHKYAGDGWHTEDCGHGCGCWAGLSRSGGPIGLDPIAGECPNNPEDGNTKDSKANHLAVVNRRIAGLQSKCSELQARVDLIKPGEAALVEEVATLRKRLFAVKQMIEKVRAAVDGPDSLC